jgi:hypothetical protein
LKPKKTRSHLTSKNKNGRVDWYPSPFGAASEKLHVEINFDKSFSDKHDTTKDILASIYVFWDVP